MMRSLPRRSVQLPAGVQLSLEQFAEDFERRGFIITSATADRIEARMPPGLYGDVIDVERWFPSQRIIITKTGDDISVTHHTPVRRKLVISAAVGLLSMGFPGSLTTRLLVGAGAALFIFIVQSRSGRGTEVLMRGGGDKPAKPAE